MTARKHPGPKRRNNTEACLRYQQTILEKECLECGTKMQTQRNMRPLCSAACRADRRSRQRPPTLKPCLWCAKLFHVPRLEAKLCSAACRVAYLSGRRTKHVPTPEARNAQRTLKYHVDSGRVVRPPVCEECGTTSRKIEGAHHDYAEPLRVRWLCRPCHIRWDKGSPKHGTMRVPL